MSQSRQARLALIQFEGSLGQVRDNTVHAVELIGKAAQQGADFVILPELFSTGYQLNVVGPQIATLAEPLDGPTVNALQKAAAQYGCYIVAGVALFHETPGVAYNSAVIIDREGQIVDVYDKQHLWALERFYFRSGHNSVVFDTDFGKVGVMICYDMGFPEVARMLALKGAELIVCPSAWCAEDMDIWAINGPARALENTVFLAAVNRYGVEDDLVMPGHSYVCNPRGGVVDRIEGESEGILIVDIDFNDVIAHRQTSPYLRDRRPDLYADTLMK